MALGRAVLAIAAVAALVQLASAVDHTVGGAGGSWDAGSDYKKWAAQQQFAPGDTLTFNYAASHDVVEVSKAGYDACSAAGPIGSYTGGKTTVKLDQPGKRYFICGVPGHCMAGMKLEVDVFAASTASGPASSKPRHKKSVAPAAAPALAPEAPATTVPSTDGLPTVTSPTAAQAPGSGAAGMGMLGAKVGMGIAMALALVFAL